MAAALRGCMIRPCFTSGVAPVRRAAAIASPAPRPQLMTSVGPSCSFLGGSFNRSVMLPSPARGRGALIVVANAKKSMGCTKEGTNRHRRRTSGYRTRMASPAGRKVLAGRRARGRKVLCPASQKKSGGKK